tara:strand:+ start:418 stop:1311 length:894 start_codon:yes stop_codon:yes gene_type:complete
MELVKKILQCPECHNNSLQFKEEKIICNECNLNFPIENGTPLFSIEDILKKGTSTTKEKMILKKIKNKLPFIPTLINLIQPPIFYLSKIARGEDRLLYHLKKIQYKPKAIILDIGAGHKNWENVIPLDIYYYPGVEICAKADKLPFSDNSVDMIVSQSAIEHIVNGVKALKEMERILKPDGIIFIEAPFIYPYHPEPYDLRRWSTNGLDDAFENCTCIESGSVNGPFSTLFVILTSFFSWLLSFRNYSLYLMFNLLFQWIFLPLMIIDFIRGVYRKSSPLDSIVYYVGKKKLKKEKD